MFKFLPEAVNPHEMPPIWHANGRTLSSDQHYRSQRFAQHQEANTHGRAADAQRNHSVHWPLAQFVRLRLDPGGCFDLDQLCQRKTDNY